MSSSPPQARPRGGNMKLKSGYCVHCRKPSANSKNLKYCGKCKLVRYCSVQCQKDAWREHKKTCTPAMESGLSITRLRQFWGSVAAFRQLVELLFIAEFKLDKVSDSTAVAAPVVAKTPIMMGCLRVYLHPIDTRKFSALLDLRLNPPDMITICPPDSPTSPLRCRPYFYDFRETTNIEEAEIDSMRPMMADHKRDARLVFKDGVNGVPEEGADQDPDVADGFLEIHLDNTGQSVQMPFTVRESTLEAYRNGDIWLAGPYKPPLPYTKEHFLEYLNARVIEDKANAFKLQANMTLRDLNVFLDVLDETLQADPVLLRKLEEDLAAGRLRI